ncbi:MAG: arginine--tRNA ligase, partial [Candidatus Dojkabacteria bacterium]
MQQTNKGKTQFFNDPRINLIDPGEWDKAKKISINLTDQVSEALGLKPEELELEHPNDPTHGDYSTNIALKHAKKLGRNPRELAEEYVKKLESNNELDFCIDKIEVAGPGFINFHICTGVFIESMLELLDLESAGGSSLLGGKRIMFEYAHPNPFKSLHIGHLRNVILGESLIRLLESQGAEVIRVNYQGDVGMHIAKTIWAMLKLDKADFPDDLDERVAMVAKSYSDGATAFKEDEKAKAEITKINKKIYSKEDEEVNKLYELGKQWSMDKFHKIYERLYSTFTREYMESETLEESAKLIKKALDEGILEESEGAVIFNGEKYGLDTRVFLNSEGLPTYEGKELGLAYMQVRDYGKIDLIIHNVAVEQISFFKVTFKAEELLDPENFKGKQYHNVYEFVGLKSGKMSSRTGNVVLAEDILDEAEERIAKVVSERAKADPDSPITASDENIAKVVGIGAVKYSFLNINPRTYLAFDLEASLNFEGNSGP